MRKYGSEESHSWDMVEVRFECWPPGLQMAKQTKFLSLVQRGVEGKKKKSPSVPGKFRACHTTDLFSASTLVKATCRIIELIAFLS